MCKFVLIYMILINGLGFFAGKVDKERAKKHKKRISEKTLFTLSGLGGSFGFLCAMRLFHHKTKHAKFRFGIPLALTCPMFHRCIVVFLLCVLILI